MGIPMCIGLILLTTAASVNARSVLTDQQYHVPPTFVVSVTTEKSSPALTKKPEQAALDFVQQQLSLKSDDVVVKNVVPSKLTGITSVYLRQKINGIELKNADVNINVNKDGRILSYGENIFRGVHPSQSSLSQLFAEKSVGKTPLDGFNSLTAFLKLPQYKAPLQIEKSEESIEEAARNQRPVYIIHKPPNVKSDVPVYLSYIQAQKSSSVELVYSYEVKLENNWYDAQVSTNTGQVLSLVDWVADATYNVFDINAVDPLQSERQLIEVSPNVEVSPHGWHSNGATSYQDTRGNNVWAQQNAKETPNIGKLYRPRGGSNLIFDFPFDQSKQPAKNADAAITQLFHTSNSLHDILYAYGFDEVSGNFQDDNGDKGGKGRDFVVANAEVKTGLNNANFATPPDGRRGVMNMYLWDQTSPKRDGIFDVGIIIHEYGHGLSTRLTGGPQNSGCLSQRDGGGMGEGWSDVLAVVFRQKPENQRTDSFLMGAYAYGGRGIRIYPYSTDMIVNPSLFSYLNQRTYYAPHSRGEVWCMILLEVYWNLVDTLGFTSDLSSASMTAGNTLFLHLIINGMKLQPCNPTFLQARDAIIQAEQALTNGTYACQLWTGFAKRGLGFDAKRVKDKSINGFALPSGC